MNPLSEERINEVQALCRRFGVHWLDVFGSAATGSFDPATSDIDFIVEFEDPRSPDMFQRYFGLKESFEALFGRPVDLVMAGAMRNPTSSNRSIARAVLSMRPRSLQLLEDIRHAAAFIAEVSRGVTLERYAADRMLRQAVERNFEVIGEAVKRLSTANRSHGAVRLAVVGGAPQGAASRLIYLGYST